MSATSAKVLVIVGPTAVGKTALSIGLGRAFGGEAISADSRQVYRHMDIGTAKPTREQQEALPHHLIDIVEPDEELTLAHYKRRAARAIDEVTSRRRLPILVGGTGLYVRALLEGWTLPEVPPDKTLRARLYAKAQSLGCEALHISLASVDPVAAQRIDPRNLRRVVRALEVYHHTGVPISRLQGKRPPGYRLLKVGLTMSRSALYERIDARLDRMIEHGLIEEVRWLVDQGYGLELPSMSGLGYREIGRHLRGETTLEEAVTLIRRRTRRFVRQQYNWFRPSDPTIHWLDSTDFDERALYETVLRFVEHH